MHLHRISWITMTRNIIRLYLVCVQISLSIMAAVVTLPVIGSILNRPLMEDDLME